jgi:hypothetical protein
MEPKLKDKLLKIKQDDVTWQCTLRRAPMWITPKNEPAYRPFILLVIDQDRQQVLKTEIQRERPGPQWALEQLLKTMQGASLFTLLKKHRPKRISIDDPALAAHCAPELSELGITCGLRANLPEIEEVLLDLEAHSNQRDPRPGLLSIKGVTVPLLAELYAAAADFHKAAPWEKLQNWMPIEIRYPADGPPRYAVILGSGREFYGLSLYFSPEDLAVMLEQAPRTKPISWLSLIFEDMTLMPFADLDAIEQNGWPVVGPNAHPLVIKPTGQDFSGLPTAADVSLLAAAIRAIPIFLHEQLLSTLLPAQASPTLPGVHGNQQIKLDFPAAGFDDWMSGFSPDDDDEDDEQYDEEDDLEEYIEGWHWDEPTHEFARQMGSFLFSFYDHLEAQNLSSVTLTKHERNGWAIAYLTINYGSYETFSPEIFLGGPCYETEYQRKFSDSDSSLRSYQATWRKLEKYVRSQGGVNAE